MKHCLGLVLLLVLCVACHGEEAAKPRPRYWPLNVKEYAFGQIELALTQDEITHGLMERDTLPSDGGMLFVFDSAAPRSFWMKNCRFPIDVVFMDANGVVVSMHHMKQERAQQRNEDEEAYIGRLPSYESGKPAQFVLELGEGQLDFLDIRVGDKLDIGISQLLELKKKFGDK